MSNPPFWGDVGMKKWSTFLVWGARSPIFGCLNMGIFGQLFHAFSNFGWVLSKFWKIAFFGPFWAVFLWARTQKLAGDVRGQFKSQWLNPNIFEFSEGSVTTISGTHLKILMFSFLCHPICFEFLQDALILPRILQPNTEAHIYQQVNLSDDFLLLQICHLLFYWLAFPKDGLFVEPQMKIYEKWNHDWSYNNCCMRIQNLVVGCFHFKLHWLYWHFIEWLFWHKMQAASILKLKTFVENNIRPHPILPRVGHRAQSRVLFIVIFLL